jgi:restriction endonuclease S subunit
MAKPFLTCPRHWTSGTLEPNALLGLITHVDSGGTPSTTNASFWEGEIPWLTPKEITAFSDGVYVSQTERKITPSGLKHSGAKLLPTGTVLLTKRAPVGLVAINATPMATNQGFLNFQCGPKLRPLYLAYWLRVNRPYLDAVANGSTYAELYKSDLFEFEISVPTIPEQDAILEVISALQYATLLGLPLEQSLTSISDLPRLQAQDRRLREIRDALLPKLLSGELGELPVSKEERVNAVSQS